MGLFRTSQTRFYWGMLAILVVVGVSLRIAPSLVAKYPLGLGGLFYTVVETIEQCGLLCYPEGIPYYGQNGVPFVYPPLGYYLTALLHTIVPGLSLLTTFKVVSIAVGIGSVLLFAAVAHNVISRTGTLVAVLAYGTIPGAFVHLIGAPAAIRGAGLLFFMIGLLHLVRHREHLATPIHAAILAMWATLACLSHPVAGLCAIGTFGLGLLIAGVRRYDHVTAHLPWVGSYALTGFTLASPFLWLLFQRNQLDLLFTGAGSNNMTNSIAQAFLYNITGEPYTDVWGALSIIGLIYSLLRKEWFIFGAFFFTLLAAPAYFNLFPCVFLALIVGEYVSSSRFGLPDTPTIGWLKIPLWVTALLLVGTYTFGAASSYSIPKTTPKVGRFVGQHDELVKLAPETIKGFKWLDRNAHSHERVLYISPPPKQPNVEWGPALSHTQAAMMPFGAEWLGKFKDWWNLNRTLANETCVGQAVALFQKSEGFLPEYVYVLSRPHLTHLRFCPESVNTSSLTKTYESEQVVIWKITSQARSASLISCSQPFFPPPATCSTEVLPHRFAHFSLQSWQWGFVVGPVGVL